MMQPVRRQRSYGLLGLLLFLALWQLVGSLRLAGPSVPSLSEVIAVYQVPWKLVLLGRAAASTLLSAAMGLCIGAILGSLTAFVAHLARVLGPGLDRLAVIVNAMPAVALAPILIVTVGRDYTPATLASVPVFFLLYVNVSGGLRAVQPRLRDVFATLGAGRLARLLYLDLPATIPAALNGLRISVTAAMVAAIVGEWFGASTGLGIVILNTMLNFQIPLMWAAVLLVAASSLVAYGALGLCEGFARRRFS